MYRVSSNLYISELKLKNWEIVNLKVDHEDRKDNEDDEDYATKLRRCLSTCTELMEQAKVGNLFPLLIYLTMCFQNIISNIRKYDFNKFYIKKVSEASEWEPSALAPIIEALHLVGMYVPYLERLMSLLSLPPDNVQLFLRHYSSFVTDDDDGIILNYFFVVSTSFINQENPTDCVIVDHVATNSNIVRCCIEALTQFMATTEVQSFVTNPTRRKWKTLTDNLLHGKGDVSYAYRYWIVHIDKCNGQLDKSTLRLLGELLCDRRALDLVVEDDNEAVPLLLNLFDNLSVRQLNLATSPINSVTSFICRVYLFLQSIF